MRTAICVRGPSWSTGIIFVRGSMASQSHSCSGYLDHPFKNRPLETEKDRHCLLANRGGSVYNQTSSTAFSCSNDDTLT